MSGNPITIHLGSRQKLMNSVLYLVATITMSSAAYIHLDFAARVIQNITLQRVLGNPIMVIVLLAILLMLASSALIWFYPLRAAKLGLAASLLGWAYFLLVLCVVYFQISIMLFTTLKSWLFFFPNINLLLLTTRNSRKIIVIAGESKEI